MSIDGIYFNLEIFTCSANRFLSTLSAFVLLLCVEVEVVCVKEEMYLINCIGGQCVIKIASVTLLFPVCVWRYSLSWITWTAAKAPLMLTGRVSLTRTLARSLQTCLHEHVASALRHSHRCGDVIRVLMRDYSDITGTAAKLNLLAPPCACGGLGRLVTCPGCTQPLAPCQLGLAPVPCAATLTG